MTIDSPFSWGSAAISAGLPHAPARPTDTQIASGYPDGEPVPAEEFNWLAYMIGLGCQPRFSTLDAAVAAMTDGSGAPIESTCIVDEHDAASAPLAQLGFGGLLGVMSVAVAGDGVIYLRSNGGVLEAAKLSRDLASTLATYTLGIAAVAGARIVTDGRRVLVSNGPTVRCFDAVAGGAALWSYTHGGAVHDVCLCGDRAFLVGADVANVAARCLFLATGALLWAYDHQADLWSCCTDGMRLFVAGTASVAGSGATLRAIVAADGTDAANEGGLGADATGTAWDFAGNAVTRGGLLATDGRMLYEVTTAGPNFIVELHEPARGTAALASDAHAGFAAVSLALDQDFVYLCGDGLGAVIAYNKRDLSPRQRSIQAAFATAAAFATDGAKLYMANAGGIARYARSNRAKLWRRIDPSTARYAPYHWLMIPEEG